MMIKLDKDSGIGVLLIVGAIIGIIVYGLLLWNPWTGALYTVAVLAISAFAAVAVGLGIIIWIGWTMATTKPPPPVEMPPPEPIASTTTSDTKTEQ
jgi:predicted DNA-binding transcriptional regulator